MGTDQNESSTLAVDREVRLAVKRAAADARLSMREYTNLALRYFVDRVKVRFGVVERVDDDRHC